MDSQLTDAPLRFSELGPDFKQRVLNLIKVIYIVLFQSKM